MPVRKTGFDISIDTLLNNRSIDFSFSWFLLFKNRLGKTGTQTRAVKPWSIHTLLPLTKKKKTGEKYHPIFTYDSSEVRKNLAPSICKKKWVGTGWTLYYKWAVIECVRPSRATCLNKSSCSTFILGFLWRQAHNSLSFTLKWFTQHANIPTELLHRCMCEFEHM